MLRALSERPASGEDEVETRSRKPLADAGGTVTGPACRLIIGTSLSSSAAASDRFFSSTDASMSFRESSVNPC